MKIGIKYNMTKKIIIIFQLCVLSMWASLSHAEIYTNSIGMTFKDIPAGSFYMGSCKLSEAEIEKGAVCEAGQSNDKNASELEIPQHKVRITKPFQLAEYEVTLAQYSKFIVSEGRADLLSNDFKEYNRHGDTAAVNYVSWIDAQAFINWLNKTEKTEAYRLPTEAEWEYAARAGTKTLYSWGDKEALARKHAWFDRNAYDVRRQYAHKVGLKKPNPWGLYDMHGNVWEWVQDSYDEDYYSESEVDDPQGAGSVRYRMYRGGGWFSNTKSLRTAYRVNNLPSFRYYSLGFRLVRQP